MELHILSHQLHLLSIAKENIDLFTHYLIKLALLQANKSCKFFSFTETNDEYTILIDEDGFKGLPKRRNELITQNSRWLVLSASSGSSAATEISGLTEITKSVIIPLANNNLSIFSLSTYQTDYILVKEENLRQVVRCLCPHFQVFQEVDGEMVPYHVEALAEDVPIVNHPVEGDCRSIVHPFISPQNRFLVTSLQPDLLPQVISTLLQIMFYSNSFLPSPQDGHERFFSFSIIEDKISLVLDTDALSLFPSGTLGTGIEEECWRMIKIGGGPLGFDESGIVAQISEPLAEADIHMYYISTFLYDHTLIPEVDIDKALSLLKSRQRHNQQQQTETADVAD